MTEVKGAALGVGAKAQPEFVQPGHAGKRNKYGGHAHFPGTGPTGKYCYHCNFYWERGQKRRCKKWMEITQATSNIEECPPIQRARAACKYFKEIE